MNARTAPLALTVTALLAALGLARPARANGRFPAAQHVLIGPGNDARTIALRATFGFVVSDDGGQTFHYVCEEALGYATEDFDAPFAIGASGALHVGLPDGLAHTAPDRCASPRDPLFDGLLVEDLDNDRAGTTVLAAAGTTGRIFRSDDGGAQFRALGEAPAGVAFNTLEVAPSDPMRVYATGITSRPQRASFFRSDDGGATLRELALPMADNGQGAFIAAIDPVDANVVYVRVPLIPTIGTDGGGVRGTALLRTADGGTSWTEIARSRGAMLGFAISDDGRTVWYGGPNASDRLQRSDDGGQSFRQVNNVQVLCLRQHAGVLYVCEDYNIAGYALGRSRDMGATVEPLVRFADVQGAFACPAGSAEAMCGPRWTSLRDRFFAPGAALDAGTGFDAGTPTDAAVTPPRASGCATRPGSRGTPGGEIAALAGLLAMGLAARRRAGSRAAAVCGAALLAACSTGAGPTEAGAADAASADAASDVAPGDDAVTPVIPTVAIQSLADPSAPDHPLTMSAVTVRGPLVALTPRLFIERSATTQKCLFAVWVGAPGGGDFSAIEVTDRYLPSDPAGDCEAAPADVIPRDVAPGDAIVDLHGQYETPCPRGRQCPAGAPAAVEVSVGSSVFRVGARGTPLPAAAALRATDLPTDATAPAPRALALQGSLVIVRDARLAQPPGASDTVVQVAQPDDPARTLPVSVARYAGAPCQRDLLAGESPGSALGDLQGVLTFTGDHWTLQPRVPGDVPALAARCPGP